MVLSCGPPDMESTRLLKQKKDENQHFNYQLTHTTLKHVDLLKHSKIIKAAPACFGLQGNNHQGATVST